MTAPFVSDISKESDPRNVSKQTVDVLPVSAFQKKKKCVFGVLWIVRVLLMILIAMSWMVDE